MPIPTVFNGQVFNLPLYGEQNWSPAVDTYLQAISTGTLQRVGGNFALLADVNFGSTYGVVSKYYKSTSNNIAISGQVRLSNTDAISWRNSVNSDDLLLNIQSDSLYFNGNLIATVGSISLEDLSDVNINSPSNNQVLSYDYGTSKWINTSLSPIAFSGSWDDLSDTPTTLSGYGITDAQPLNANLTSISSIATSGYAYRDSFGVWTTGDPTYTLPIASASVLGGIKIGTGLNIDGSGVVSVIPANDGLLTMNVSGVGLSGSATFTANQSGNSTFTVTSNATSTNTVSTIVARDSSGNFSAGTITASLSGNATTASSLQTSRNISISGDASWTVGFDGAADVSAALTLATVNSNVGSFGDSTHVSTFTVNAKGLITAASSTAIAFPVTSVNSYTGAVVLTKSDIGLSNVENIAISTWAGSTNLNTLGTISTGTWNGSTVGIAYGGTGQTTPNAAFNALAPSQTGNANKFLKTDGSNTSWTEIPEQLSPLLLMGA